MSEAVAEKVFYDRDGVRVTSARFQVGAQTYAMNAVSSVAYQRRPASYGFAVFLGIAGGAFLLLGLVSGLLIESAVIAAAFALAGLFFVALTIYLAVSAKPTFVVALTTASGQSTALSNWDSATIESVVRALNEALVSRG